MPTIEVRMPEDEKEGTEAALGTWFKRAGDAVTEHEPLVEINTDKVTIEIASPATGRVGELLKLSGDAVLPGELLGTIETGVDTSDGAEIGSTEMQAPVAGASIVASATTDEGATLSPAVRRMLREFGLDAGDIPKTSRGGRITPQDIADYLKADTGAVARKLGTPASRAAEETVVGRKVPHSPMRKAIAKHMLQSVQTAPHVTAVFEADMSSVFADRLARKESAAEEDVPSVTAYVLRAAVQAIALFPEVNSKWHDAFLEQFDFVNLGVGTAMEDGGLVVPVIRDAQDMDLSALSQSLRAVTKKAREGKLTQADMQGGTFTLSNHGVGGSLLATPIILAHGQAAILGTGKIQKRVIVCETGGRELFRVRPMMYVTLTVDHRVLDGQQTNGFLTAFVKALELPIVS